MTRNPEVLESLFWLNDEEWYVFDPSEEFQYRLTDKAPQRAVESFEKWLAYRRAHPEE